MRLLFNIVLFSYIFIYSTSSWAFESSANLVAEFSFDPYSGMATVPLTLGGVPYIFAVNTGAENTSFDCKLRHLLTPTSATARVASTQGVVALPAYRSPEGRIRGIKISAMEPVWCRDYTINHPLVPKIDGCLGMDALASFVMQFDYDRGKLYFLRSVPANAGERLSLEPTVVCPAVGGRIGNRQLIFRLATAGLYYGAGCISKRDFIDLESTGGLSLIGMELGYSASGKALRAAHAVNLPLSLGPYRHVALVFSPSENSTRRGVVLGVGYLRRYLVTFDFPGRAVYLAPSAQFHQIDATQDPSGVRLRRDGDQVIVTTVTGIGKRAGVKPNDVLEAANEQEVKGVDDVGIMRLLLTSDRPTSLIFRSQTDGEVRRVNYDVRAEREHELRNFIAPSARN